MLSVLGFGASGPGALAQQVLMEIHGTTALEGISPVARIGDVDGDGTPDLLISSGGVFDSVRVLSGSTGALLLQVLPTSASTGFGFWIDSAGDFNGDGLPDFVVGAPAEGATNPDGIEYGAVYVFGATDGALLASFTGQLYQEGMGRRVAGLGDVDGDGYDDVGVAPTMKRTVRIYGGPGTHLIRQHVMGPDFTTRPSIAAVGDVDGDGRPDYIIGWPQDDTAGNLTGTAVVFSGRTGNVIHVVHGPTATTATITGSHLGASVAGVGDVDGDGIPDFAVGAPGTVELQFDSTQAMVRVYSGADASIIHEWRGTDYATGPPTTVQKGAKFGFHVAGGGDLNGDGVPDVLVSAPNDASGRGSVNAFCGKSGERLWRATGTTSTSRLHRCAILGDLDGDGLADFAVGDPRVSENGHNSGRITVFAGAPGELSRHCPPAPTSVGPGMRLEHWGALSIGNNLFRLYCDNAIPSQMALFVYGPERPPLPFGDGFLCTGPPVIRLGPPLSVSPQGKVERELDFTQPPLSEGPGHILPGSTWSFQLYCRDPSGPGGSSFNLSDALSILFPP